MIEAVVFDLGNVLVGWDRRLLFEQLIADPAELDHFLDHVLTLEENAVLDRGVPLAEMTADLSRRHPDQAHLFDAFRDRWIETIGPVIDGSVRILEDLAGRGELRLLALSNWGADTFAQVQDRYGFFAHFEAMVISGHEGVVKPDPAIFELLISRHDLEAEATLFIDDSQANIATAKQLGFDTVLFTGPGDLREGLEARNIL